MAWTIVTPALCAFRTLLSGSPIPPPPPDAYYSPSTAELLMGFLLSYLLAVLLILLVLPARWANPIVKVAFHLKDE
jgi:hypothetical protein